MNVQNALGSVGWVQSLAAWKISWGGSRLNAMIASRSEGFGLILQYQAVLDIKYNVEKKVRDSKKGEGFKKWRGTQKR